MTISDIIFEHGLTPRLNNVQKNFTFPSRWLPLGNHPYHHHLCHQHRHHHDHHHHPPPLVQRPKSASPPLDGRRNCRPTFPSLSAHLVHPGCRGEFNKCRFSSNDELGKINNWFFLPFSGRSRPSCPDGETGRVLENLDLRRGILLILQYKHCVTQFKLDTGEKLSSCLWVSEWVCQA